jgi:hypothetical protein
VIAVGVNRLDAVEPVRLVIDVYLPGMPDHMFHSLGNDRQQVILGIMG